MRPDVTDVAWCLTRVRALGLVVGPRGVRTWHGGTWRDDPTPWARAPEHHDPWLPALDSPADSDRAGAWVADACRDDVRWLQVEREWSEGPPALDYDPARSIERVRWADARLALVRPDYYTAHAVLRAMVAASRVEAAGGPDRTATVDEAAHVLGVAPEALRARVRRGDVRTVRVGSRRCIPWAELERLVAEASAG